VTVKCERDLARVQELDYLIRLDMLPPPCIRQKRSLHGMWLGLTLYLPSCLFVMWKVFTG
jgi:hypothetical protein